MRERVRSYRTCGRLCENSTIGGRGAGGWSTLIRVRGTTGTQTDGATRASGQVVPDDRRLRHARARWLLGAVRSSRPPGGTPPESAPPSGLAASAARHGVEGKLLRYAGWLGAEVPGLRDLVHGAVARHQRALAELEVAQLALSRAGVDALVVKGPALAAVHRSPEHRSYVDLDLLVRPSTLGLTLSSLEAHGFTLLDANWPLISSRRLTELRLAGPSGGAVDLHWSLSSAAGVGTSPAVSALIGRSRLLESGGVSVRTLSWPDTVVHTAVHAADSGGHRLVWVSDLWALLRDCDTPTARRELLEAAQAWGALSALRIMLARAERVMGETARLPSRTVPLRGPWPAVVAMSDRLAPMELAGVQGSLCRLVARSARRTGAGSCLALGAKACAWVAHGGVPPPSPGVMLDPHDPRSALFPAGGDQGRADFVAAVERRAVLGRD